MVNGKERQQESDERIRRADTEMVTMLTTIYPHEAREGIMDLLESEHSSSSSEDDTAQTSGLSINKKFAYKFEREARFKDLQR